MYQQSFHQLDNRLTYGFSLNDIMDKMIIDINMFGACMIMSCWITSTMGSSTMRSWLVSTIDSHTVVFVWLLTRLQGASTALAKHESTFIDYILLGPINSNMSIFCKCYGWFAITIQCCWHSQGLKYLPNESSNPDGFFCSMSSCNIFWLCGQ